VKVPNLKTSSNVPKSYHPKVSAPWQPWYLGVGVFFVDRWERGPEDVVSKTGKLELENEGKSKFGESPAEKGRPEFLGSVKLVLYIVLPFHII